LPDVFIVFVIRRRERCKMFFRNAGAASEKKVHIRRKRPAGHVIYYKNSDIPVVDSYIADMSGLHDIPTGMHRSLK
jgi:hypothetical protein